MTDSYPSMRKFYPTPQTARDRYSHDPEWSWSEDYAVGTFDAAGLTGLLAEVWALLPWNLDAESLADAVR